MTANRLCGYSMIHYNVDKVLRRRLNICHLILFKVVALAHILGKVESFYTVLRKFSSRNIYQPSVAISMQYPAIVITCRLSVRFSDCRL